MVPENTKPGQAIGDPVVAEDKNGDVLTYTLIAAGDNEDVFAIDWATGQLMTKDALDEETEDTYMVTVRATDPAGMPQIEAFDTTNSAEITVTITVTDVNEPPDVTGEAAVDFAEDGEIDTAPVTYMADNPEDDEPSTWSLSGDDAGKFEISTDGVLTFEAKPDFEKPGDANTDNVYEVTVVAADADGNRGTMDVKVTVTNADEDGVVTLSRTQPRVGVPVTASLTDPDGSISGLRWQWYRGDVNANAAECVDAISDDCLIKGARSDTYTPTKDDAAVDNDNGATLSATATYKDGFGADTATVESVAVTVDTRNSPPAFEDQDTETKGIQNETATREVEENTEADAADDLANADDVVTDNVDSAVVAEDPDPNADPLIYTLSGADAGSFRVRDNGQIEVAAGAKLDYEMKDTYMVTLTAEDSFGASASIMVTIMVTDVDEPPEISEGGLVISGMSGLEYAENDTDAVDTYMVSGPDADMATWTLEGDDAGDFRIGSSSGVLTFVRAPDYENAADADMDNEYMVTVMANDGTNMDTQDVTVRVTDVDEETASGTLLERYDTDDSGVSGKIDKSEILKAAEDYFAGELTKPEILELAELYFA